MKMFNVIFTVNKEQKAWADVMAETPEDAKEVLQDSVYGLGEILEINEYVDEEDGDNENRQE